MIEVERGVTVAVLFGSMIYVFTDMGNFIHLLALAIGVWLFYAGI